ncbi:tyrosine-protein phosphatase [Nocardioides rubriscoriae]|uniref:tyrosine-protein phosphatase n=1 Tax=Nocardioides rubriscoriae TaxID=642762 RepID=UPI0011DF96AD|nr:tyrosine-protein phosphatase [Nocardioides rubriscoriae]
MSRALRWDGYHNVRDLGGLPTPLAASGLTVRGRLARGPRRELLTATGWDDLRAHGIRSIVDLRNADEVGMRVGDPAVTAEVRRGIEVVRAPTEDQSHEEFMRTCVPILDRPAYWAHNLRLLPDLIAGAVSAVARARPGVLLRCAAGRDRTGMICALLLANAGVPVGAIADDYETSVRAMAGTPAHAGSEDHHLAMTASEREAWIRGARRELVEFVDGLGDVGEALVACGVTPGDTALVRNLLTG